MAAPAVEVRDLAKRFGRVQALAGVSLRVEPGEFFALLGPNGAGKTTLISVLGGLANPDSGSAAVMGHDVRGDFRAARVGVREAAEDGDERGLAGPVRAQEREELARLDPE